jgi:hypothetical protein
VSLHYSAPVCSIINACFLPFTEGLAPFREIPRIGLFIMSTNALAAFGLNVAAVFLISAAGGLTLTLAGVFKDILLITASVVFFGSPVTLVQVFGELAVVHGADIRILARTHGAVHLQERRGQEVGHGRSLEL